MTTFLELLGDLSSSSTGRQLFESGGVVLAALLVRVVAVRVLERSERLAASDRLRWRNHLRTLTMVVLGLGLVFIWGSDLREFLLSLVVLASALVLATKELLMCLTGTLLRATTRGFEVGDRIEADGIRGDVVELGILGTTLLEVGPGHRRTGRLHVIPNSLFLSKPVTNETFWGRYVLHAFAVPIRPTDDWRVAMNRLLEIATDASERGMEEARAHLSAASKKHGIPPLDVEPKVTLHAEKPGELWLRVRLPAAAQEVGRVEQEVVQRFFEPIGSTGGEAPSSPRSEG